MNAQQALVDLDPLGQLAVLALALAAVPLAWLWWRQRHAPVSSRLSALTLLTLFLTFDLVVFGAFTRLSDSGLGCPDWPGCYGEVSPWGAKAEIAQAEAQLPDGPVTTRKAWIEMIHRYLAMTVGLLILVTALVATWHRQHWPRSIVWVWATLVWVMIQGLFGKYTVTLKLYPAIVTAHLLGGLLLLALLTVQHEHWKNRALVLPSKSRIALGMAMVLIWIQVALGGWVSTNYAVLACTEFPLCQGQWWPPTQFSQGFTLLRPLGQDAQGGAIAMEALVAIHLAHRWFALLVTVAVVWAAARLWTSAPITARALAAVLALQILSGLSNVVLGWPLLAALTHSAGAAALVVLTTSVWTRSRLHAARDRASLGATSPPTMDAA